MDTNDSELGTAPKIFDCYNGKRREIYKHKLLRSLTIPATPFPGLTGLDQRPGSTAWPGRRSVHTLIEFFMIY